MTLYDKGATLYGRIRPHTIVNLCGLVQKLELDAETVTVEMLLAIEMTIGDDDVQFNDRSLIWDQLYEGYMQAARKDAAANADTIRYMVGGLMSRDVQ